MYSKYDNIDVYILHTHTYTITYTYLFTCIHIFIFFEDPTWHFHWSCVELLP